MVRGRATGGKGCPPPRNPKSSHQDPTPTTTPKPPPPPSRGLRPTVRWGDSWRPEPNPRPRAPWFFLAYLQASDRRNPLSWAAATYLLNSHAPSSRGPRTALAVDLPTRACTHAPSTTSMMSPFTARPTLETNTVLETLWVVTDGALTAHALGGGIVLLHLRQGILCKYLCGF